MSSAGSSAGDSSAGSAPVGGSTIINDRFWKDTAVRALSKVVE
jgi:hypothetical protein